MPYLENNFLPTKYPNNTSPQIIPNVRRIMSNLEYNMNNTTETIAAIISENKNKTPRKSHCFTS